MDAAQIAAMIADREAGTPGAFEVVTNRHNHHGKIEVLGPSVGILGFTIATDVSLEDAKTIRADMRRIASVPDMEAHIIAQSAKLERLRAERDALRKVITEGRRAIGDHFAPHDCYATGPMTGDPIRDLVQCPACSFIAMHDESLKGGTQ